MKLKDLKQGEFFTMKEIVEPTDSQVWVRGYYDRASNKYVCHNFDDVNNSRLLKADMRVYTAFNF